MDNKVKFLNWTIKISESIYKNFNPMKGGSG